MLNKQSVEHLKNNFITLVGTFSRTRLVDLWFERLLKMDLPREKIQLIIFNNTDNLDLHNKLCQKVSEIKTLFKSVRYYQSNRQGGRTLLGQDNNNFYLSKLKPIYDMWKDVRSLILTDIFMQIEDDTLAPVNSFPKLLNSLLTLDKAGLVTAIETGRSHLPYQKVGLGVGSLKRDGNKIILRTNPSPDTKGIIEIDACGVYCFIAFTKIWKKAFEDYDSYVQNVPFFGMDLILTNNIQRLGYKLYADFSLWCDHLQLGGDKIYRFNKKNASAMGSVWIPEFNNYAQGIEIKKSVTSK